MSLPEFDKETLKKPLGYNPTTKKFIFYQDILSGKDSIVYPEELSMAEKKILVIERLKRGPDFSMQSMSGGAFSRNDVIEAIVNDQKIGQMSMEAELSMLNDLLKRIAEHLKS